MSLKRWKLIDLYEEFSDMQDIPAQKEFISVSDLEKIFEQEFKIKKKRRTHDDYTRIVAIGNLRNKILGEKNGGSEE